MAAAPVQWVNVATGKCLTLSEGQPYYYYGERPRLPTPSQARPPSGWQPLASLMRKGACCRLPGRLQRCAHCAKLAGLPLPLGAPAPNAAQQADTSPSIPSPPSPPHARPSCLLCLLEPTARFSA